MEYISCQVFKSSNQYTLTITSHPADREQPIQYNGLAVLKRAQSSINPLAVMFLDLSNAPVVFTVLNADLNRSMDLYVFWNCACLSKMPPRYTTRRY
jgi:hypothetical protein